MSDEVHLYIFLNQASFFVHFEKTRMKGIKTFNFFYFGHKLKGLLSKIWRFWWSKNKINRLGFSKHSRVQCNSRKFGLVQGCRKRRQSYPDISRDTVSKPGYLFLKKGDWICEENGDERCYSSLSICNRSKWLITGCTKVREAKCPKCPTQLTFTRAQDGTLVCQVKKNQVNQHKSTLINHPTLKSIMNTIKRKLHLKLTNWEFENLGYCWNCLDVPVHV